MNAIKKRNSHLAGLCNPAKEEDGDDGGEILGGTGYGRWGRVFLFSVL